MRRSEGVHLARRVTPRGGTARWSGDALPTLPRELTMSHRPDLEKLTPHIGARGVGVACPPLEEPTFKQVHDALIEIR